MSTIGIFIVDDHDILVDALVKLLSGQNTSDLSAPYEDLPYAQRVSDKFKIEFKGRARNRREAFERLPNIIDKIDLVLLDIGLPVDHNESPEKYEGLSIGYELHKRFPKLKIAFLTQLEELEAIEEAKKMGANGYITKDFGQKDLTEAIIKIHTSNDFVLKAGNTLVNAIRQAPVQLDERELQIINYVVAEWTAAEIAVAMKMTQPNVERQLRNIRAKLLVESAAGLAREAVSRGIAKDWEKYRKQR